jgi:hypothetical protein
MIEKKSFYILLTSLLLISQPSYSQSITFKGSLEQFFIWQSMDLLKDSVLLKRVVFNNCQQLKIDSLPKGKYSMIFNSRFNSHLVKEARIRIRKSINVKLPTIPECDSIFTDLTNFLSMLECDTLNIVFTQRNCYLPYLHIQEARIFRQNGNVIASYPIAESDSLNQVIGTKRIVLTTTQIERLLEVQKCSNNVRKRKMCSTIPTFYLSLNSCIKIYRVNRCMSLYEILDNQD